MLDVTHLLSGDEVEVSGFGKKAAEHADDVFDGTFFPAVEGSAEEGAGCQALVNEQVLSVFGAIVVGDGLTAAWRQSLKSAHESMAELSGAAADEHAEQSKTCFSLVDDEQDTGGFAIASRIGLPMTDAQPGGNRGGPEGDGDALRNVRP